MIGVASCSSVATAGPRVAGGLDFTIGRGSTIEAFDLGLRLEPGLFLSVGPWHLTASLAGFMRVESTRPTRDGGTLSGIGLGGRLAYHYRFDRRGVIVLALGFERVYLDGNTEVRRQCRESGDCLIGYYTTQPDYNAWAPQARIGLGLFADNEVIIGTTAELIVEPIAFRDVPPSGAGGVAVFAAITTTIGGGSKGAF